MIDSWQCSCFWMVGCHYIMLKSDYYKSQKLLNTRLTASISGKYSELSVFDSIPIHTELINKTVKCDLKAGLEQIPKSHVKTVASVQLCACF